MPRRALAIEADQGDAVVSREFLDDRADRTRPYGLDVREMTNLDRLVETAVWNPEEALAALLAEFGGEAEKRAAAIAHLLDPERRRWPKGAR